MLYLTQSQQKCQRFIVWSKRRGTGPLEFCEAIHPLLANLQSTVKIGFMDDITLAGDIRTIEADVNTIINHDTDTGLKFNISKTVNSLQ